MTAGLAASDCTRNPDPGVFDGQAIPLQAVGNNETETLTSMVKECLLAVETIDGTLQSPRWLAFDRGRVTANLPIGTARPHTHPLSLQGDVELEGMKARARLERAHH